MKKSYRIAIVLLSAAFVVSLSIGKPAFGQRFKLNVGNSNQNSNKKDNDQNNNNNNQGGQGSNQSNQGSNQNKSGSSNKSGSNSGNSSTEDKIKQYLQNKINQGQGGNQPFIQGQGNSNNRDFGNRNNNKNNNDNNFNDGSFRGNYQSRNIRDEDEWHRNQNRLTIGTWNGNQWQGSRKADNWNKAFGNNQKLFSKQWYDDHPHAHRWDNHNHKSDVWVVASVPGVYQWLGWGAVPQEYRAYYNPNNVPRFDPNNYGDWYPLGVYSLMSGPDDLGTRVVQLSLDRHGHINGTYYDMITDNTFRVTGDMQQQTQRAQWTLNSNPNVRFSASLFRLLQPDGSISVQLPGGVQRWQFVRLEN